MKKKVDPFFWGSLFTPLAFGAFVDWVHGNIKTPPCDYYLSNHEGKVIARPIPKPRNSAKMYRQEWSVGFGFDSQTLDRRFTNRDAFVNKRLGYTDDDPSNSISSALGIRHYYHIDTHWAVGAHLGIAGYSRSYFQSDADECIHHGDLNLRTSFLLAQAKYYGFQNASCHFI